MGQTVAVLEVEARLIGLLVLTVLLAHVDGARKLAPVALPVAAHAARIYIERAFTRQFARIYATERAVEGTCMALGHAEVYTVGDAVALVVGSPQHAVLEFNGRGQLIDVARCDGIHAASLDHQFCKRVGRAQCQGSCTYLIDSSARTLQSLVQGQRDVGRHTEVHATAHAEGLIGDDGLAHGQCGSVVDGDLTAHIAQSTVGDACVIGQ